MSYNSFMLVFCFDLNSIDGWNPGGQHRWRRADCRDYIFFFILMHGVDLYDPHLARHRQTKHGMGEGQDPPFERCQSATHHRAHGMVRTMGKLVAPARGQRGACIWREGHTDRHERGEQRACFGVYCDYVLFAAPRDPEHVGINNYCII